MVSVVFTQDDRVRFAMLDLTEFGWVILNNKDDAKMVVAKYPRPTILLENECGYLVEEVFKGGDAT